jgi:hypothetical protein
VVLAVAVPRAAAQTGPGLDIRLERDPRPGALSSPLAVNLTVTVTEQGTGAIPADDFDVFAFAEPASGAKTEIFPCAQEHDNSPDVPRGLYMCTVLIDHGGRWTFSGVVNQRRANAADPLVALGRAERAFDIDTGEVAAGVGAAAVKGRAVEVALLWGHTAAAGAWLLFTALIAALALPAMRTRLSPFGLHRLEERFDLLVKSTWTATGLLVGSGTYLLLNQTAYETPFSSARMDAVFRLPYGKPYFLTLAAKLVVYAVMLAASTALLREARRRLRVAVVAGPVGVRVGTPVLVAGTVVLSLSITLLKYFHELIEAARAAL